MKIEIVESYPTLSSRAAQIIAAAVEAKPTLVLGLPTGSTPVGLYEELVREHRAGRLALDRVTTFNLDEYVGLGPDHPDSYASFMRAHLFAHVNVTPDRTHIPNGVAEDPAQECERYEALIQQVGRLDLVVLGVGTNGHLGFNEPAAALHVRTHVAALSRETLATNFARVAALSPDTPLPPDVPRRALTMGIGTILQARRLLLLASGRPKAPVVAAMLRPTVTTQLPASLLHLHRDVTVLLDSGAAAEL